MLQRSIRRIAAPLALLAASTVVAVLLAEAVLRVAMDPADFLHATLIEDPILGQRIQPLTTGHDALGYRNRAVPENADIVAIGDSMTYGVSAPRDGSWPKQLGAMLGEEVYNMGLGASGRCSICTWRSMSLPSSSPGC